MLVHFHYSARVPGARERTVARCKRVRRAIETRYAKLHEQGLLHCQMAVSDLEGSERCTFVEEAVQAADTVPVKLIDSKLLLQMLTENKIGVTQQSTSLYHIDEDYFSSSNDTSATSEN